MAAIIHKGRPLLLVAAISFGTFVVDVPVSQAGSGPFGIDHKVTYDDSGIYKRDIQKNLIVGLAVGEVAGALWEGNDTRFGHTLWQSIDATLIGTAASAAGKVIFTRARPSQSDDPNDFFQGGHHYSFPSGEVTAIAAMVTPIVAEYRHDDPWVYALEALPLYDAIARVKVNGHWQSDVLVGWALGTAAGLYAHGREQPLTLKVLPDGVAVGLHKRFN